MVRLITVNFNHYVEKRFWTQWGNSFTVMVNTVANNKEAFTPLMPSHADTASRLHIMIEFHIQCDYLTILKSNGLKNNSATRTGTKSVLKAYGPPPASIMSNMTRPAPAHDNKSIIIDLIIKEYRLTN